MVDLVYVANHLQLCINLVSEHASWLADQQIASKVGLKKLDLLCRKLEDTLISIQHIMNENEGPLTTQPTDQKEKENESCQTRE